jgi:hypothetical protein
MMKTSSELLAELVKLLTIDHLLFGLEPLVNQKYENPEVQKRLSYSTILENGHFSYKDVHNYLMDQYDESNRTYTKGITRSNTAHIYKWMLDIMLNHYNPMCRCDIDLTIEESLAAYRGFIGSNITNLHSVINRFVSRTSDDIKTYDTNVLECIVTPSGVVTDPFAELDNTLHEIVGTMTGKYPLAVFKFATEYMIEYHIKEKRLLQFYIKNIKVNGYYCDSSIITNEHDMYGR